VSVAGPARLAGPRGGSGRAQTAHSTFGRSGQMDRLRGFRQGLKEDGYVEREKVVIEYENSVDLLP
jgi:hypothetical protein